MNRVEGSRFRRLLGADVAPDFVLSRWVFLRFLGVIYLIAFVSLWVQVHGLLGSRGILPVTEFLQAVRQQLGWERYWHVPTIFWWSGSDAALGAVCGAGVVLSLMVIAGLAVGPSLIGLWGLYLSVGSVGREFLSFQWDVLLLETGLLAVFLAPWQWRPGLGRETPPSRLALWLLWWLLFRLMFASGMVKLTSGDAVWRNLTALEYHYETQPLPPWTAWYAHHLPAWFQQISTAILFLIELVVPCAIAGPRRVRLIACATLVFLQLLIIGTGNYCFFNLLSLALCGLLVDDAAWRRLCPAGWRRHLELPTPQPAPRRWRWMPMALFSIVVLLITFTGMAVRFLPIPWADVALRLERSISPLRSFNNYGLFAVMTTRRPEIIIEGSVDGIHWQAYEFRYKPGDPRRRPGFVAPHQPRLDWQMWFAALGQYQGNQWVLNFMGRLLEGSPPVLALLEKNPFRDQPPRYIRATVYDYHFTDARTRRETGQWWRRESTGLYCPVLSLRRE
jgi:hypothetical protein